MRSARDVKRPNRIARPIGSPAASYSVTATRSRRPWRCTGDSMRDLPITRMRGSSRISRSSSGISAPRRGVRSRLVASSRKRPSPDPGHQRDLEAGAVAEAAQRVAPEAERTRSDRRPASRERRARGARARRRRRAPGRRGPPGRRASASAASMRAWSPVTSRTFAIASRSDASSSASSSGSSMRGDDLDVEQRLARRVGRRSRRRGTRPSRRGAPRGSGAGRAARAARRGAARSRTVSTMKGRSSWRIWITVRPGRSAGFATRTRISPGSRAAAKAKPAAVAAASARSLPLPTSDRAAQERRARTRRSATPSGAAIPSAASAITRSASKPGSTTARSLALAPRSSPAIARVREGLAPQRRAFLDSAAARSRRGGASSRRRSCACVASESGSLSKPSTAWGYIESPCGKSVEKTRLSSPNQSTAYLQVSSSASTDTKQLRAEVLARLAREIARLVPADPLVVLVEAVQQPRRPGAVALEQRHAEIREALEHAAAAQAHARPSSRRAAG